MEDLRTNKTTKLYIIVEDTCDNGNNNIETFIFDDEKAARKRFESLVWEDEKFLARVGSDDIIDESENYYCSFPEGEYSTTHYWVTLSETNA